ncbi:MAG TPA: helix-turn-helix domain-containing protein [Ktedonobacteraceae bacterium]
MNPIQIRERSEAQLKALAERSRTTHDVRLRTRAHMVVLAAEQHFPVAAMVTMVRESEGTGRCWLKRDLAEGIEGLKRLVGGGAPLKVTKEYQEVLRNVVRPGPRSLGQPYAMWTVQRLADDMAEQTGLRVGDETVRVHLTDADIVVSRPQHTITSPDPDDLLQKRRVKTPVMG